MRSVSNERIIKIAFLCSLLTHCLFLGIPQFNLDIHQVQKPEDITVEIKIEKPLLLPKIDVMGEEKKIKEIVKEEQLPEPEPEPEPKPQPEEEIAQKLEPKEQIEEVVAEKLNPEPPKEIIEPIRKKPSNEVEAMNLQEEAMLRYQDMVKQKIESCRRYPKWAKKQRLEGVSHLAFTLLSNGMLQDIKLIHSSGFNILDKESISTVRRASPFKTIPQKLNCSSLTMQVDIVFQLKR